MLAPAGILREPFYKKYKILPPAGIFREPFYKIVKIVVASVASCRVGRRVASVNVSYFVYNFLCVLYDVIFYMFFYFLKFHFS